MGLGREGKSCAMVVSIDGDLKRRFDECGGFVE